MHALVTLSAVRSRTRADMLVTLVASVALAASAAVALPSPNKPRVQRRDYTGFYWEFDSPTPTEVRDLSGAF